MGPASVSRLLRASHVASANAHRLPHFFLIISKLQGTDGKCWAVPCEQASTPGVHTS